MFFSAYLGEQENLADWQEVVQQHASWLELNVHFKDSALADGRIVAFSWLYLKEFNPQALFLEMKDLFVISTTPSSLSPELGPTAEDLWGQLTKELCSNTIRLGISRCTGELRVVVPPTTPEQFYITYDKRGYVLGNDMRLLTRWAGLILDERAIYALLQYGAIPAPFTISQNLQRIPNGHILKLTPQSTKLAFEPFFWPGQALSAGDDPLDAAAQVAGTLDQILSSTPDSSVLYFSGGVDSSLMAARFAEMGRTDVILFNYAFGPEDPEGQLALEMAGHLDLKCKQVMYQPVTIFQVLENLGRDYSFPFCDSSVLPTRLLVQASLPYAERSLTVIEGTAADGAFGRWTPNGYWFSAPAPVRWLTAESYRILRSWQWPGSKLERWGRLARRSVNMSPAHAAVMARNSFDHIAYNMPGSIRQTLEEVINTWIETLSSALAPEGRLSYLDVVHICAGIFAAKSFDPLRKAQIKAVYPFLEPPMIRLSYSLAYDQKCAPGDSKTLLKTMLAQYVPEKLVYRPKSGFIPPFSEILNQPEIQEFVRDVVLAPENPVIHFCRLKTVKQMFERAEQGQPVNIDVHKFLWSLIFTSAWLRQQVY